MTAARWMDCEHKWDSSREVRICRSCGQVRTFPSGGANARIVWQGRGSEAEPSKEDKACIAGLARRSGIKEIAALTGLDWKMLRAWIGAYCRKPKVEETKPKVEEDKEPKKPPKPRESVTGSFLPAFPPFNERWTEMVQLRWFDTYRALALGSESQNKRGRNDGYEGRAI